jgi:hypothetical protein
MKFLLFIATIIPVYLYAILPSVVLTYDVTIAFTLISLLSLSIAGCIALLLKGSK